MLGTETLDSLTGDQLEQEFSENMKAQERLAIQGILAAKEAQILSKATEMETYLQAAADELKGYATEAARNIKGGLEGKAGTAADTYLTTTMQKPRLENPIKS